MTEEYGSHLYTEREKLEIIKEQDTWYEEMRRMDEFVDIMENYPYNFPEEFFDTPRPTFYEWKMSGYVDFEILLRHIKLLNDR